MHRARAHGAHADREVARQLGPGAGGEGRRLLVAKAGPVDSLGGPDGIGDRIEGVADHSEDVADAEVRETVDDHLRDGTSHGVSPQ
ncbi:hypothetical protein GCM10010222_17440 [Streptomyces tanashiensis]|nr:hypothetical protein GCM10010222_17440 [Streptomyces tanashiensis]